MMMLLLLLLVATCAGQQLFRTELFPEQLEQQQVQFQQRLIQDQLQLLQRQLQVAVTPQQQALLLEQQGLLLQRLRDGELQLQELQRRLQQRLLNGAQLPPVPPPAPPQVNLSCQVSNGEPGLCRPLIQCVSFYGDVSELRKQKCRLANDDLGVCCPLRRQPARPARPNDSGVLRPPPPPPVVIPPFTPQQLDQAANVALEKIRQRIEFVAQLFANNVVVQVGTPAAWHQEFFQTSNATLQRGQQAQKTVEASVALVNEFQLSPDQGRFALPTFSVLNTVIADTCSRPANCQASKYRSADGSCNNLANERWGSAGSALQRILPPKYGDGVNAPRTQAANGEPLPSARLVSTKFAKDMDHPSENLTMMVMQWGQFMDHDLTHTPISRGTNGFGLSCCRDSNIIKEELRHPDCFPISLPDNDHIFSKFQEHCMEFVRSLPAPRPECNFGPREQMNQITGFIDGSNVYGSSADFQRGLREGEGGRMKVQNVRGRQMLPQNPDECSDFTQKFTCFAAGDSRANEQIELTVMHTLWMREHNRVAKELAKYNPTWNDETLFQEARRIVIAEMQHINYNEFLPIVLGRKYMEKAELLPKQTGYSELYDESLNPSITNAFATAAFRFGHSLIQGNQKGYSKFGNVRENLVLSQHQFAPFALYNEGAYDDFLRGLATQSCQRFDHFFSKELTDKLFQGDLDFGLDLVALNIQRGRDHGLPPYNDWREVCGLPRAKSWDSVREYMDPQVVKSLQSLYKSVDEIDLFVGAVAEVSLPGALVGPTFVCLIGDQFARLRRGDRYFYEEDGQISSFTPEQLNQIRKVSFARILCDNSDDIALMQPLAFFQASLINQRVSCRSPSIPEMDLKFWTGERVLQKS